MLRKALKRAGGFDPIIHRSFPLINSGLGPKISGSTPRVLNLHWLGEYMLSIREIGAISHPILWTVHDEWVFRGAEHYGSDERHILGYPRREAGLPGLIDIDRLMWLHKKSNWFKSATVEFVAPNTWASERLKESALLGRFTVHKIPYPVETAFWTPGLRAEASAHLGVSDAKQFICFGAVDPASDYRKGGDLFQRATTQLKRLLSESMTDRVEIITFGTTKLQGDFGLPVHHFPRPSPITLRAIYRLASVTCVPSRQDNSPLVATESIACGTPVVGFDVGGMPDIVRPGETGLLVMPFDHSKMARAMLHYVSNINARSDQANCRAFAEANWSPNLIARRYESVASKLLHDLARS